MFWSFPHVIGFYACVLAFVFLKKVRYKRRIIKILVVGFLLVSAFYSSVFSIMALPLFLLADIRILYKRFFNAKVLLILLVALLLPISIFLHKPSAIAFIPASFHLRLTDYYALNRVLSFPVWLIVVSMIEFFFTPFMVARFQRFSSMYRVRRNRPPLL